MAAVSMLHRDNYPNVFKRSYTVLGARQKQSNKDFLAALAKEVDMNAAPKEGPLGRRTGAKEI